MIIEKMQLNDDLIKLGVIELKKQDQKTILLLLCKNNSNNKQDVAVIFLISKDGPYDTLLNFENTAKRKLDKSTIEAIKVALLQDNKYLEFLLYGDGHGNGKANNGHTAKN